MAYQQNADPSTYSIGGMKLSDLLSADDYSTLVDAINTQRTSAQTVADKRGQFDSLSKPDAYNAIIALPDYQGYSDATNTAQSLLNKAIQARSTSGNSRYTPSGADTQGILSSFLASDPAGTPDTGGGGLGPLGPLLLLAAAAPFAAGIGSAAGAAGTAAASAAPAAAGTAAAGSGIGSGIGSLLSSIGSIPSSVSSYLTGLTGNSVLGSIGSGALTGGVVNGGIGALTGQSIGKSALTGALTGGIGGGLSNLASQALGGTQLGNLLGITNSTAGTAGQASSIFANPSFNADASLPWSVANGLGSTSASSGGALSGVGKALGISNGNSSSFNLGSLLGAGNDYLSSQKAQKAIENGQNNALNTLQPYLASGASANSRLSDLLGTSGNTSAADYGSLTTPFTADSLQNDAGYQFRLQQGQQALDRQQSAKGGYFSGSALKAAEDYGQGLADTTYNDAYQRDLNTKNQTYNMYSGQANQGYQAANAAGNIYQAAGQSKADSTINSGNIISQLLSGAGKKYLSSGYY